MAITFFKTPKHKQFNYRPVYWDKEKEERDKKLKSAMEATERDNSDYAKALKERMDLRWKRSRGARARKNSNIRLIIIMAAIGLVLYFIFLG